MDKRLKASLKEQGIILEIVRQMMFVYGDDEKPLPSCEHFVLDLVKHQLLLVTNKAWEVAKLRRCNEIQLSDLLYPMRHHPDFMMRLLRFAQAAQKIAEITREADDPDEESIKNKKVDGAFTCLVSALNYLEIILPADNIENFADTFHEQRQLRMANRVVELDSEVYVRFTEARKANFCFSSKRGTRRAKDPFSTWLGHPPLGRFGDFVLAFIARETIAGITDDAAFLRNNEKELYPRYFLSEGLPNTIQMRHYEQALRRNLGFRRNGDYLFGFKI